MIIKEKPLAAIRDERESLVDFLHTNLIEFRDTKEEINHCFNYLLELQRGGRVFEAITEKAEILGLIVVLNTHMKGFMSENYLVYIAVDNNYKGQGIGGKLLDFAQEKLEGGICLHVETDNPALSLYKRKGFTNKYLEMRYNPNGRTNTLQK